MHYNNFANPISAMGHKRQMQCEPTGGLFPLFPKTGNVNAQQQNAALCQKRPNALQQTAPLFDHLVGALLKEPRHVEAERLRGLEIDRQLELDRGLDGKLARLRALQDAIDVDRRTPKIIELVISVG